MRVDADICTCMAGFSMKKLEGFLLGQPSLEGLLNPPSASVHDSSEGILPQWLTETIHGERDENAEMIQDLDPRIQERIRAAVAASTCKNKFGG